MANPDAPFGLKPVGHLLGLDWNASVEKCYVSSSYGTALFVGDPVDINTTLAHKDATAKYQSVAKATAGNGNYVYGVIVAIEPNRDNLTQTYIPASTGGYVYVCVDPFTLYHIRDDGAATPTYVQPGQNGVFIYTHSGNTTTGISGVELDMNSDPPAADASNQLFIRRLADIENNDLGTHAIWEVLINLSRFRASGDGDAMLGVTAS
jgi:hypothetical protein